MDVFIPLMTKLHVRHEGHIVCAGVVTASKFSSGCCVYGEREMLAGYLNNDPLLCWVKYDAG